MLGKIKSIKEVFNIDYKDGYSVETENHKFNVLIDGSQCCCQLPLA